MENEKDSKCCGKCDNKCENKCEGKCGLKCCKKGGHGVSSCAYGLGFVGALIYFIQNATSFWMGIIGVGKAIFWPAFLVYKLLGFLGM